MSLFFEHMCELCICVERAVDAPKGGSPRPPTRIIHQGGQCCRRPRSGPNLAQVPTISCIGNTNSNVSSIGKKQQQQQQQTATTNNSIVQSAEAAVALKFSSNSIGLRSGMGKHTLRDFFLSIQYLQIMCKGGCDGPFHRFAMVLSVLGWRAVRVEVSEV